MTPIDLDAVSAAAVSWLLTYAIHSTILLGAALAIAMRFADEHAWLDLVWKTAMLGPLVTASVQVGADVRPLGGRWPIGTATPMAIASPELKFGPTYGAVPELKVGPTYGAAPELKVGPTYDKGGAASDVRRSELQFRQALPSGATSSKASSAWPLFAVAAWLAIGAIGLVRFGTRFVRLHRTLRSGPLVSAPHLRQMVEALSKAAGTRSPIRLTTSPTCAVPLALPGRRVVLPERFLQQQGRSRLALTPPDRRAARRSPVARPASGDLASDVHERAVSRVAHHQVACVRGRLEAVDDPEGAHALWRRARRGDQRIAWPLRSEDAKMCARLGQPAAEPRPGHPCSGSASRPRPRVSTACAISSARRGTRRSRSC